MPFGFPSERAFSFTGIPSRSKNLRFSGCGGIAHLPQVQVPYPFSNTLSIFRRGGRSPIGGSAGVRCSENCSWSFPQLPIGTVRKCLILLRNNLGGHLPWAQGVVSSNLAAPTN